MKNWLLTLLNNQSPTTSVLILGLVATLGLALGTLSVRKVKLGVAGVLFAGLLAGHLGLKLNPDALDFARDLGLVLFVYTVGIQVGPGFLASLRRQGLRLNLLAVLVVGLGAALAVVLGWLLRINPPALVGLFAGATTNTPSLAAAEETLRGLPGYGTEAGTLPGLGYAVAYPFGVLGVILTMLLTRAFFRIDPAAELRQLQQTDAEGLGRIGVMNLLVQNSNLEGVAVRDLPLLGELGLVVSRVMHENHVQIARPETLLHVGDVLVAVGERPRLDSLRLIVGREAEVDLTRLPGEIDSRRLIVTRKSALDRRVLELAFAERYGVVLSRIIRAGIELTPRKDTRLHYGDVAVAVGTAAGLDQVAGELGNQESRLNHPELISLFLGIALGVIVGSLAFRLPGVSVPVKLGLAGGPLLVAIALSWVGRIGPLVWYMLPSANFMLREVGIVLFLACVGLKAGDRLAATLFTGNGLIWLGAGALITALPILLVALLARWRWKLNFLALCGLLAGSMTDPPALAFATSVADSDAPSTAYATVYPLTMVLRILLAQLMLIFGAG